MTKDTRMTAETIDPNGLPSAKVRSHDRAGVDGWLKFHAAFSRSFAFHALRTVAEPGDLVVDPFCGSGTTARAAGMIGARCVTVDLNPALVALARAALLGPSAAQPVVELLLKPRPLASDNRSSSDGLQATWLHGSTARSLEAWRRQILASPSENARSFARGLLVRAARRIVNPQVGTNPTWPRPPLRRTKRDVQAILLHTALGMATDLNEMAPLLKCRDLRVKLGDARSLPLSDGCVDAALTSPPYLSRLDYVRATLPELIALGWDDEDRISQLRQRIMGGVLATRHETADAPSWGAKTKAVLASIHAHESKASASYYSILARQYFADLGASLRELCRVLKPGARGLIVVQTSYYKNVCIPLPALVREMLAELGQESRILQNEVVAQHYGQLSPYQRGYVPQKTLNEAVILFHR